MELHLVRHGRPDVIPDRPSNRWSLSTGAQDAVARLRACDRWPRSARWFSSPEPKARQTAGLLSDAVTIDDRLGEAVRSTFLPDPEAFTAAVARSFAEPDRAAAPGWEPLARTRARMADVLADVLADVREVQHDHRDGEDQVDDQRDAVVLVGHGTAFSLLVSLITGQPVDVDAWRSLTMPDHWCADLDTGRVLHDWGRCHHPDPGLPTGGPRG